MRRQDISTTKENRPALTPNRSLYCQAFATLDTTVTQNPKGASQIPLDTINYILRIEGSSDHRHNNVHVLRMMKETNYQRDLALG